MPRECRRSGVRLKLQTRPRHFGRRGPDMTSVSKCFSSWSIIHRDLLPAGRSPPIRVNGTCITPVGETQPRSRRKESHRDVIQWRLSASPHQWLPQMLHRTSSWWIEPSPQNGTNQRPCYRPSYPHAAKHSSPNSLAVLRNKFPHLMCQTPPEERIAAHCAKGDLGMA